MSNNTNQQEEIKTDFELLKAAIKHIEDDLCIAVDYDALDFIQQMIINNMLNVQANGVYTFFDLVQRIVEERVYMKSELEYYKNKSTDLEIKLKKYLGQWREPQWHEIVFQGIDPNNKRQ